MVINMFVESMYEGELKKQKERFLESILFALLGHQIQQKKRI